MSKHHKKRDSQADYLRYILIKGRVLSAKRTFADIARDVGVSPSMVTQVAKGRRTSKRVQGALAAATGIGFSELWGDEK